MQIRTRDIGPSVSRYAMAQYGGEVFYVDATDGNDLFDGKSTTRAKATIQAAVDIASAWSTIFIKAGLYVEEVAITTDGLQLAGASRDAVELRGPGNTDVLSFSHVAGCQVRDLKIDLLVPRPASHGLSITACTNCLFQRLIISSPNCDVAVHLMNSGYITLTEILAPTQGDTFYLLEHDSGEPGPSVPVEYNVLTKSVIYGMTGDGVIIGRTVAGASPTYTEISECIFHSGGNGVLLRAGSSYNRVFHNTFWDVAVFVKAEGGNANTQRAFENFYNDVTGDANNDGIRDSPEVMTGITDYAPASWPNIWERVTLGLNPDCPTVDSTANVLARDIGGNKADTANITPDDVSSLMRYVKGALNQLAAIISSLATHAPQVTQTTGTLTYDETSASEQTLVELAITARATVGAIWVDMVNATQDIAFKLYHKIDASNFREIVSYNWLTTDSDGVLIEGFTAYRDVKITLTCGGGGAGSVDVPYAIV